MSPMSQSLDDIIGPSLVFRPQIDQRHVEKRLAVRFHNLTVLQYSHK